MSQNYSEKLNMIKYFNLRNQNYKTRRKIELKSPAAFDVFNWKKTPYSSFKAIIYISISIFTYLIQFTSLSANHVSLMYSISGVVGGFLILNQ